MGRLSMAWLGTPVVVHAGRPVTFPTRKTLALLIYLSTNAGPQSREKLAALLWPESDDAQGRASLRRSVAFLRQALPEGEADSHLLVEREALSFNFAGDAALDLRDLQAAAEPTRPNATTAPAVPTAQLLRQLQAAAPLYRGDFLEGFSLADAPGFDDWASVQREYWHRQVVALLTTLSQQQSDAGAIGPAVETAARWVTLDPLDEQATVRLMTLHLAHGDRAAALAAYDAYRATLATELRAEPTPETQALAERARAGSMPARKPPPVTRPLLATSLETPLVGRAAEFNQLVEAFHTARAGRPQVVIVEGEAGIGKTRLAGEFLSWAAAHGASVLQGRAFETGGALPYQSVVEALRSGLADPATLRGRLTDTWLSELARLLPELRDAYPDLPQRPAEDTTQAQLFEAVARLGETLAQRAPVVLFLDDVQWAEAASLDLLHYVGRRWVEAGAPMLMVAGLRTEAAPARPAVETWLAGMERDLAVRRLPLLSLTLDDLLQIVQALEGAGSDMANAEARSARVGFNAWLFAETAGQPLFIVETLKALVDRGVLAEEPGLSGAWRIDFGRTGVSLRGLLPPGVREVIRSRLARQPAPAQALLSAAAVLGRQASFERLRLVAGLGEDEALAALEGLLGGRLLREGAHGTYVFTHDKVRDVVYAEAGSARQQVYHRRALERLEAERAPAAELAHHARQAGLAEPAIRHGLAAGDHALQLFAARDAIGHYEQALALMESEGAPAIAGADVRHLLAQLGRAYDLNGELDKAQRTYERLLAEARQAGDAATERLSLNRLATLIAQIGGNFPAAKELLGQALAVGEASHDLAGLAETEWNLAQMGYYTWDEANVLEHAERALRLAHEAGGRELTARSHNVLGLAHWVLGRFRESAHHARLAQQLYAELGNRVMEADSQCVLAEAQIRLGQAPAAIDSARLAYATGGELRNPWGQIGAACRLSLGLKETGQLDTARLIADDALAVARVVAAPHWLIIVLCLRGAIYRDLCDLDRALAEHLEALTVAGGPVSPIFKAMPGVHLCADYAAMGEWDQAYRWLPAAPSWHELTLCQGLVRRYAIETLTRHGELERAMADVHAFETQAADNSRYRIAYLRCLAILSNAGGDADGALAALNEASALANQLGLPNEAWPICAELSRLYRARGAEAAAQQSAAQAQKIVHGLAGQIADEPMRTGFLAKALT